MSYGGVTVTENMESVLKMNPKMMMYGKIDGWDIETEIEKGFTKCRYSKMKKSEERNNEILDLETKTLNYCIRLCYLVGNTISSKIFT